MSQLSPPRQPRHGCEPTAIISDDGASDFRSAAMTSVVPLPKAVVSRSDDLPARDAAAIVFDQLGLVIAVETDPRRESRVSRDRPHDTGFLRVRVPRHSVSATLPVSATRMLAFNENDPVVRSLAEALAAVESLTPADGAICVDALRLAVVARLSALQSGRPGQFEGRVRGCLGASDRQIQGLQKWRLKRVLDYIESHFCRKVQLADLAAVAGLSRMHFAAQFRIATGCSPHEYILRERIRRAKDLLRNCEMPIVEIALTVGFQSQAHFTTTFRRFAGDSPRRWRNAAAADLI
ncbi:AraC family transcriptional regulator [Bradyrhizobium sp. CCGE-LA001]|nr:AraC family transcriptional regulator [Bradyrhizobium sp. CCGE-LA001]